MGKILNALIMAGASVVYVLLQVWMLGIQMTNRAIVLNAASTVAFVCLMVVVLRRAIKQDNGVSCHVNGS